MKRPPIPQDAAPILATLLFQHARFVKER